MEEKVELLLEGMNKINQKIDKKINELHGKMDNMYNTLNIKMDNMHDEINEKINFVYDNLHEEITQVKNQHFLFEHEYGMKIDAIFDAVTMELDKNLEKSEKIGKLEKRMDRSEVKSFEFEKRIATLELKS